MDLLLASNGDLAFSNGQCPVTTSYEDSVAQRLEITLRTFLGEWFLDTEIGVPYFESIFIKQQNKSAIDIVFQEKILSDVDVEGIVEFDSQLDKNRNYSATFKVSTVGGTTTSFITVNPLA